MSEKQSLLQGNQQPSAPAPEYVIQPSMHQGMPQQPPPSYQDSGYPPAQHPPVTTSPPPPSQTVLLTNPVVFGDAPVSLRCPNCQRDVVTSIQHETGLLTWLLVFLLFLLGFCCCCWIPCCIDATKDVIHTCPNCKYTCGVHKKIG